MTRGTPINFNQAVFTTTFVMHQSSPVVHVIHDAEGAWHFVGAETDVSNKCVMLVSLQQMIDHDPTLSGILNLPERMEAFRQDTLHSWEKSDLPSP